MTLLSACWLPLLLALTGMNQTVDPKMPPLLGSDGQPAGHTDPLARDVEGAKRNLRPVPIHLRQGAGLALWSERSKLYVIDGNIKIELSKRADGLHDLSVVHSGYSEPDPDGRMALITVGLSVRQAPVEPATVESLRKYDVELSLPTTYRVRFLQEIEIDIDIPVAPQIAEQVRKSMRLPLRANVVGRTIPIQVKFEQLAPNNLRQILLEDDGLQLLCRRQAVLTYAIGKDVRLDKSGVLALLSTMAVEGRCVIARGDIPRLADVIVGRGLVQEVREGEPMSIDGSAANAYVELVIGFLQKHSAEDDREAVWQLTELQREDFSLSRARQVELPFVIEGGIALSTLLRGLPDTFIKDTSTGRTGIGTIPKDEDLVPRNR